MASAPARPRPKPTADTRWLSKDEEAAWRVFLALMVQLPWALECQLQRDAQLSIVEYHALAMLSDQPEHVLRMSDLAVLTHASLSRLSHLIKRLEARGFVRREPDPRDGRYTLAVLTPAGHQYLKRSAPDHVAKVRELVVDVLSPEELSVLHDVTDRILERIQPAC